MRRYQAKELVFAIVAIAGSTVACAEHGDLAMVEQLASWIGLAAEETRAAGGQVVKVLGAGLLLTFPASRVADSVAALRAMQQRDTVRWQRFDNRCRVQIKVGIGTVMAGPFGPPGRERDDIYGDALNRLFKLPVDDFVMSPDISERVA